MAAKRSTSAAATATTALTGLVPQQGAQPAHAVVEQLGLWERPTGPPGRPRVMINMVSTVDGRATLAGRSGPLSGAADRELFHALRATVDGVLVGGATVRAERYGRIIPDAGTRALRRERGLAEEPLACIVSGRLEFDEDLPLFAEPATRAVIVTPSAASTLPARGASVEYVRAGVDGQLDLRSALAELRTRFAVESLLCEGGPHLCRELLASGLADELFLSLSPKLAGGEPPGAQALRILAGVEFDPALELELLGVLRSGSALFLRYGVVPAPERVSRETIASSSLAR